MHTYRIDSPRRLVLATWRGTLSAEEISKWQAALAADPAFDPSLALITDIRTASLAEVTPPDVRQHAEEDPFGPETPRAIVVSNDANYGVARMFEAYSELARNKGPVRTFRDPESAWAWIESVRSGRH